jgi:putative peptidoglycan lipid II flippase
LCAIPLTAIIGIEAKWGVVGLTASASVAAWIEFLLLRRSLNRRIGRTGLSISYLLKLWVAAMLGAGVGWGLKLLLGPLHPVPLAFVVLGSYGVVFFAVTHALGISEARTVIGQILRLLKFTR